MMIEKLDYEAEIKQKWQHNLEEFWDNPLARMDVAKSFAERKGLSEEVIRHWLCTNDFAAYYFAKDPAKQTSHQLIAGNWIKSLPFVTQFQTLPAGGDNALHIIGGRVVKAIDLTNKNHPKSIDFSWEVSFSDPSYKKLQFYASHKYTKEGGGAQDNQFNDLYSFTEEASGLQKDNNTRILSLADGEFYNKQRKDSSMTRLQELNYLLKGNKFVGAMTCSKLPQYLATQIQEHISKHKYMLNTKEQHWLKILQDQSD